MNDCLEKGHGNLYMLIRLYLPIMPYFQEYLRFANAGSQSRVPIHRHKPK